MTSLHAAVVAGDELLRKTMLELERDADIHRLWLLDSHRVFLPETFALKDLSDRDSSQVSQYTVVREDTPTPEDETEPQSEKEIIDVMSPVKTRRQLRSQPSRNVTKAEKTTGEPSKRGKRKKNPKPVPKRITRRQAALAKKGRDNSPTTSTLSSDFSSSIIVANRSPNDLPYTDTTNVVTEASDKEHGRESYSSESEVEFPVEKAAAIGFVSPRKTRSRKKITSLELFSPRKTRRNKRKQNPPKVEPLAKNNSTTPKPKDKEESVSTNLPSTDPLYCEKETPSINDLPSNTSFCVSETDQVDTCRNSNAKESIQPLAPPLDEFIEPIHKDTGLSSSNISQPESIVEFVRQNHTDESNCTVGEMSYNKEDAPLATSESFNDEQTISRDYPVVCADPEAYLTIPEVSSMDPSPSLDSSPTKLVPRKAITTDDLPELYNSSSIEEVTSDHISEALTLPVISRTPKELLSQVDNLVSHSLNDASFDSFSEDLQEDLSVTQDLAQYRERVRLALESQSSAARLSESRATSKFRHVFPQNNLFPDLEEPDFNDMPLSSSESEELPNETLLQKPSAVVSMEHIESVLERRATQSNNGNSVAVSKAQRFIESDDIPSSGNHSTADSCSVPITPKSIEVECAERFPINGNRSSHKQSEEYQTPTLPSQSNAPVVSKGVNVESGFYESVALVSKDEPVIPISSFNSNDAVLANASDTFDFSLWKGKFKSFHNPADVGTPVTDCPQVNDTVLRGTIGVGEGQPRISKVSTSKSKLESTKEPKQILVSDIPAFGKPLHSEVTSSNIISGVKSLVSQIPAAMPLKKAPKKLKALEKAKRAREKELQIQEEKRLKRLELKKKVQASKMKKGDMSAKNKFGVKSSIATSGYTHPNKAIEAQRGNKSKPVKPNPFSGSLKPNLPKTSSKENSRLFSSATQPSKGFKMPRKHDSIVRKEPVILIPENPPDSDASSDESVDESKIPAWARKENLSKSMGKQRSLDPDSVFPDPVADCNLFEIFSGFRPKKRYRDRTSTGNWSHDNAQQWDDTMQYKNLIQGFKKKPKTESENPT